MNCFCEMVDRRKLFTFISGGDHCHRISPLQISDKPPAGFQLAQNLSSGFVERSFVVAITNIPRRQTTVSNYSGTIRVKTKIGTPHLVKHIEAI